MAGPDLIRAVLPSPLGDLVVLADGAGVLHGLDFAEASGGWTGWSPGTGQVPG